MDLQWAVFDVVGTLLSPHPSVGAIYHDVGKKFGSRHPLQEVERRFRDAFHRSGFSTSLPPSAWIDPNCLRTDEPTERRIWSEIVGEVLDDVDDFEACFLEIFERFSRSESWRVLPGVERAIDVLRSLGIKLAVASNFDGRLHRLLDGIPALKPIDKRIISSEVGYHKPSLYFFRAAEAIMGVHPHRVVLLGDHPVNDVRGARRAGWHAVRIAHVEPSIRSSLAQPTAQHIPSLSNYSSDHEPSYSLSEIDSWIERVITVDSPADIDIGRER